MKKNFYKEYLKNSNALEGSNKDKTIIIEKPSIYVKMLGYIISTIHSIFKILIFLFIIILLSIGATVILNMALQINLMEGLINL